MSLFHVIEHNGPSTFEKASELHAETPKIQVPNVQATSSHDEHVRPSNFTEENTRSSLNNQNFSSPEPDGKGDERMKVGHSFTRDDDAPEYNKENGVHWASSPDHLDLPQKPFHHSNNFDSPCVSDSGSDILSKREVIQKLRQQLKARDGMILEMQDQIAELQNSLTTQLSHYTNLQSLLDAANRDLFDSEREIQRLRKAIADHCVGQVVGPYDKPSAISIRPSEGRNGIANGHPDVDSNMDSSETGRGDGEKIEVLRREVSELKEVIDRKEYLLQSYKEQKTELSIKIKELQQRLDSQLPNFL